MGGGSSLAASFFQSIFLKNVCSRMSLDPFGPLPRRWLGFFFSSLPQRSFAKEVMYLGYVSFFCRIDSMTFLRSFPENGGEPRQYKILETTKDPTSKHIVDHDAKRPIVHGLVICLFGNNLRRHDYLITHHSVIRCVHSVVPQTVLASSANFDNPKSVSIICPSLSSNTFSGFRSLQWHVSPHQLRIIKYTYK